MKAKIPVCLPLEQAPLWSVPLEEPPSVVWLGMGIHGKWAREDYRLPGLWCVHLYRWTGALRVDDTTLPIRPGYASIVPPDRPLSHFFRAGSSPPSVHVSSGFALLNSGEGSGGVYLPMMLDLGEEFGRLNRLFEEAIGCYPVQQRRAEARLWEILWLLSERATSVQGAFGLTAGVEHPAVAQARVIIELRLGEPLRVADLAHQVDLSHNHLTRLFREATGQTVVGYLRERRVARARHLLQHTTAPIKTIASQVGLSDLHQFNKTLRAVTGSSPRALRHGERNL